MLDIRSMSEKDKVFLFVNGLQPWAKTKIHENKVQDLATAIASVETPRVWERSEFPKKNNIGPKHWGQNI